MDYQNPDRFLQEIDQEIEDEYSTLKFTNTDKSTILDYLLSKFPSDHPEISDLSVFSYLTNKIVYMDLKFKKLKEKYIFLNENCKDLSFRIDEQTNQNLELQKILNLTNSFLQKHIHLNNELTAEKNIMETKFFDLEKEYVALMQNNPQSEQDLNILKDQIKENENLREKLYTMEMKCLELLAEKKSRTAIEDESLENLNLILKSVLNENKNIKKKLDDYQKNGVANEALFEELKVLKQKYEDLQMKFLNFDSNVEKKFLELEKKYNHLLTNYERFDSIAIRNLKFLSKDEMIKEWEKKFLDLLEKYDRLFTNHQNCLNKTASSNFNNINNNQKINSPCNFNNNCSNIRDSKIATERSIGEESYSSKSRKISKHSSNTNTIQKKGTLEEFGSPSNSPFGNITKKVYEISSLKKITEKNNVDVLKVNLKKTNQVQIKVQKVEESEEIILKYSFDENFVIIPVGEFLKTKCYKHCRKNLSKSVALKPSYDYFKEKARKRLSFYQTNRNEREAFENYFNDNKYHYPRSKADESTYVKISDKALSQKKNHKANVANREGFSNNNEIIDCKQTNFFSLLPQEVFDLLKNLEIKKKCKVFKILQRKMRKDKEKLDDYKFELDKLKRNTVIQKVDVPFVVPYLIKSITTVNGVSYYSSP